MLACLQAQLTALNATQQASTAQLAANLKAATAVLQYGLQQQNTSITALNTIVAQLTATSSSLQTQVAGLTTSQVPFTTQHAALPSPLLCGPASIPLRIGAE